jgi:hypothetical protein
MIYNTMNVVPFVTKALKKTGFVPQYRLLIKHKVHIKKPTNHHNLLVFLCPFKSYFYITLGLLYSIS